MMMMMIIYLLIVSIIRYFKKIILLSHSTGNNGNKFDESVAPCNTPSCNALYDGCHYYYLPWAHDKPCVCVECSWEDIAFRLEPINILSRLGERLVSDKSLKDWHPLLHSKYHRRKRIRVIFFSRYLNGDKNMLRSWESKSVPLKFGSTR